jgi:hypothetical protein
MAGAGRKVWTGETLSVPDLQNYLQDQAVMVFPNAAARSAAIPAPTEGMTSYLADVNRVEFYTGTAWVQRDYARAFLHQSQAQTGLAPGWQDIYLNAETIDTHGGHITGSAVAPMHFYTVPVGQDGRYRVSGNVTFGSLGGGCSLNARIVRNAGVIPYGAGSSFIVPSGGNGLGAVTGEKMLDLVAGNTLHMQGFCTIAWSTGIFSDAASSLSVERID